jgi:tetratricopeptide (TPR) repeat protein
MYKYFTIFLLLLSIASTFITCSQSFSGDQLNFGILAARKELWDEAIFRWKKVIQSDPNSSAAHNNLAVAYEKKGLWEEAKKEYELALKLSPNNEQIIANFEAFKENYESFDPKNKNEKK